MHPANLNLCLGDVVISDSAHNAVRFSGESVETYVARHRRGDWGEVDPEDAAENEDAARTGRRVVSTFLTDMGHHLLIVTEGGFTRVLSPEEF